MADGQVVFEIEGDNRTLKQTLNETPNAIEKESRKWDKAAGDAAGGMENKMASMFAKISAAAVPFFKIHHLGEVYAPGRGA